MRHAEIVYICVFVRQEDFVQLAVIGKETKMRCCDVSLAALNSEHDSQPLIHDLRVVLMSCSKNSRSVIDWPLDACLFNI